MEPNVRIRRWGGGWFSERFDGTCPDCGAVEWLRVHGTVPTRSEEGQLLCWWVVFAEDYTPDGIDALSGLIEWQGQDILPELLQLNLGLVHWRHSDTPAQPFQDQTGLPFVSTTTRP